MEPPDPTRRTRMPSTTPAPASGPPAAPPVPAASSDRGRRTTALVATHDPVMMALADRVVRLQDGVLTED